MATIMEMPKLSDTMSEGAVARWLKKEGETVRAGSPVVEIETDKATMEYEAPAGGVLLKILVGDGAKCPLQAPMAVLGKAEENWEEALANYVEKKGGAKSSAKQDSVKAEPTKSQEKKPELATIFAEDVRVKVSPLAKKMAADQGIDLKTLTGSGPQGRIVQRDLPHEGAPRAIGSALDAKSFSDQGTLTVPLTNMRKTIARRLTESVTTAPHFFLTLSVAMDGLLNWRKEALKRLPESDKFSVNDMVLFLTARALKRHPEINASWKEVSGNAEIVQYRDVHMSFAVALPGGLITPTVRYADRLSLVEIAKEAKRLVALAKDGKLQPSDYSGGTFSVSNLGMSGIEEFTAIINPPQAAILAVGATLATPVVQANGSIGVEQRMKITLSCDHRVIDGAMGAEFLKTLKNFFEDPFSALFLG